MEEDVYDQQFLRQTRIKEITMVLDFLSG